MTKEEFEKLKDEFEQAVIDQAKAARKAFPRNYDNVWEQMISDPNLGAYEATKKIMKKKKSTTGFEFYADQGRLDLVVETLVVDEKFQPLFTTDEIETAKVMLEYGKLRIS